MSTFIRLLLSIFLTLILISCSSSSFSGGGRSSSGAGPKPTIKTKTTDPTKDPSDDQTVDTDSSSQTSLSPCPKISQQILVIDLKSGWWAGDGARFFDKIMRGISAPCVGTVEFEYHHILVDDHESGIFPGGSLRRNASTNFESMFQRKDWNQYTQIWLLSGSESDSDDLKFNDPLLNRITSEIASSKSALFLGTGFGSITHARKLASVMLPHVVFATSQDEGETLSPDHNGLPIKSILTRGVHLLEHILFGGVTTLVDEVYENPGGGGLVVKSDYLTSTGSLTVIGRNRISQPIIAVGETDTKRRVVIDTGLQRYYSITQSRGAETLKFIQNILVYLGSP